MTNINIKLKADETSTEDDLDSSTSGPIILPGNNIIPWRLIQQEYFSATKLRNEGYRSIIRSLDGENSFAKSKLDEFFIPIYAIAAERNTKLETLAHLQLDELKYRIDIPSNSQDIQQIVNFHDFYSRRVERKFVSHLSLLDEKGIGNNPKYVSKDKSKELLAGFENSRLHIKYLANNNVE